jgi:hypothetical protein
MPDHMTSKEKKSHRSIVSITPVKKDSRITCPAIPKSVNLARKKYIFGDLLLERPPESNSKLRERSSIPCGPEKKDRISSFLVDKGFKIDRAEMLFSLLRRLSREDDERPIEADERHVWLGSSPIGIVMSFMDKPTLHVWVDQLLTTSYRNGSMSEVEKDIQHILSNTRALSTLVDAFELSYGMLASTIAGNRFAALVADKENTCLRFYEDRTAHPTMIFKAGGKP